MKRLIVAVSGASGIPLAFRTLQALKENDVEIHLIVSEAAKRVMKYEGTCEETHFHKLAAKVYGESEVYASLASGSYHTDGMIIVPCSMKTLSAIANAFDENLIVRAADVCLKERRKLVLVPRETPLNNAHLRNMLTLSQDGAVILPPMLSFYAGRQDLEQQIDQIVGKILSQFDIPYGKYHPWEIN